MIDIMDEAIELLKAHWKVDTLRPAQARAIEAAMEPRDVLAFLPTGYGKCFGRGTVILMHDGTFKYVEDVAVGDLVMGPDSKPRRVLNTCTGREPLYRVTPKKGNSYVVNESHILSLKTTGDKRTAKGRIVNVNVRTWLNASKYFRHTHKGWRTGVDFPNPQPADIRMPPYILGAWLGDGQSAKTAMTTADREISDSMSDYAKSIGLVCSKYSQEYEWGISTPGRKPGRGHFDNPMKNVLMELGVWKNKHIPSAYLRASRKDRLELLAGLIDTDGTSNKGACFDITLKSATLSWQVAYLARSLGFAAYVRPRTAKCQTGAEDVYYRIGISGDTSLIPTHIHRKKNRVRQQKKDVLVTGIEVKPIGVGDYFGFAVDGDHLFLLGDFTVVHNSAIFQIPALMVEGTAIVMSPLISLMKDQCDDCIRRGIPASFINSHVSADVQEDRMKRLQAGEYKVFYVAPERIRMRSFRIAISRTLVSFIVVDEAHCASRWGHDFRPAYNRIIDIKEMTMREDGTRPPIIAVTATATSSIETDLVKAVGLSEGYARVVADPVRSNLSYEIVHGTWSSLHNVVRRIDPRNGRHIIYVGTRKGVEAVCNEVKTTLGQETVRFYHAGLDQHQRTEVQEAFKSGEVPMIVATNAFGMGIDVPNIRTVIHFGIPGTLEDYVQEAGRAGRDGGDSRNILIVDNKSVTMRQQFLNQANPAYFHYRLVWNWFQENTYEGEIVSMSDVQIAEAANELAPQFHEMERTNGYAVSAVLSTMEAHGVVGRSYYPSGFTLDVDIEALRRATTSSEHQYAAIMDGIYALFVAPFIGPTTPPRMNFALDIRRLTDELNTSSNIVKAFLRRAEKRGVLTVGQEFNNKTSQLLVRDQQLFDVLPEHVVAAKRRRDETRLEVMVQYTSAGDRRQFIRDYFLHDED